jgi:hypothetical protein
MVDDDRPPDRVRSLAAHWPRAASSAAGIGTMALALGQVPVTGASMRNRQVKPAATTTGITVILGATAPTRAGRWSTPRRQAWVHSAAGR